MQGCRQRKPYIIVHMDCGQSRRICGTIVAGYEDVLEAFKTHVIDGIEIGSQVCCYVKGLKVYDLYSTKEETDGLSIGYRQYGADSIQNLFSTSKVLTSLVVAMLADRGHLQYEQPVASLWPEYAQHGKSATTIAQVMRHEAGLPSLDQPLHAADLMTSRIKEGSVSELIAAQKPSYIPGEGSGWGQAPREYGFNASSSDSSSADTEGEGNDTGQARAAFTSAG